MSIIISKSGKDAKRIDKSSFEKEDYLQKYIYDNPDSIPLYDIKEDIRLLILAREFPTNSGPIDAIGIDRDGEIYLVETKLYKNPDKRLVVAQVLDYGASLWRGSGNFSDLIKSLDNAVNSQFKIGLHQKLKDFFSLEDIELNELLDNFKKNLDEGNFKFVVLMDKLHDRLKDLIVFINQNSQFDIFAVELEYYKHENYEIMIPKLFGAQVKKDISVSSASVRRKWDETQFIAQTKELMGKNADKLIKLYQYLKDSTDSINWGTGAVNGSFAPIISNVSKNTSPFSFYSNGDVLIKFSWLLEHSDKETVEKQAKVFVDEYNESTNLKIPNNYLKETFKISSQEFVDNYDGIVKAIKKLIESVK